MKTDCIKLSSRHGQGSAVAATFACLSKLKDSHSTVLHMGFTASLSAPAKAAFRSCVASRSKAGPPRRAFSGSAQRFQTLPSVQALEFGRKLQVIWSDHPSSFAFHGIWLRDNCACSECCHEVTHQRLTETSSVSHKGLEHLKGLTLLTRSH